MPDAHHDYDQGIVLDAIYHAIWRDGLLSSLTAEGLIRTLYRATSFQFADHVLEWQVRLALPYFERLQVLGIFRQAHSRRLVDEIGQRPIRFRRFQAQRAVKRRVEIHRGAFWRCGHAGKV